jgi:hypothetical protein
MEESYYRNKLRREWERKKDSSIVSSLHRMFYNWLTSAMGWAKVHSVLVKIYRLEAGFQ